MSSYEKRFSQQQGAQQRENKCSDQLRADYPNVVLAFEGRKATGDLAEIPPCTIMLFLEGGSLKFCLSPKSGREVGFGTLNANVGILEGLEWCLDDGQIDWKPRGPKRA